MRLPYQPFRDHGELHSPRRDRDRADHADFIPGSSQSNRGRAELVALRRLGTIEDCAKVVEFLATDLSEALSRKRSREPGGRDRMSA
jgi:hypothetical protein